MYGLKHLHVSGIRRNSEFLTRFKFEVSNADRCVYRRSIDGEMVLLALYVDDGLVLARSQMTIKMVLEALKSEFEVTTGNGAHFLSIEIEKDPNTKTITIKQEQYIQRMLEKFSMMDAKPISTPAEANKHLKNLPEGQVDGSMKRIPYQQAVGSLMFTVRVH